MSRYFGHLPEADRIKAHKLQEDLIRQNRKLWKGKSNADFYYSMLILALWKMQSTREILSKKTALTIEEAEKRAEELRKRRVATFIAIKKDRKKKASPKASSIDSQRYHLVARLRSDGLSWRDTAEYLDKHHKIKISHSYLRDVYIRENKDREKRGDKKKQTFMPHSRS